jgi:hypothetical protein
MSEELTPYNAKPVMIGGWSGSAEWRSQLNTPPQADEIKSNPFANGAKFLPISAVEDRLDSLFNGLWKTHSYTQQVIANEVTGSIILEVMHPSGVWLSRVGTAAVIIQQDKGAEITDLSAKIKNTLVKDIPHLKSECIKNAAKSLGKAFGRNLNRASEYGLESDLTIEQVQQTIDFIEEVDDLLAYWKSLPRMFQNDVRVRNMVKARKAAIKEKEAGNE